MLSKPGVSSINCEAKIERIMSKGGSASWRGWKFSLVFPFFFFFFFACECFYVTKSKPKKFKIKHLEVIWTGESLVNITRGEMVGYLLAEISNLK